MKSGYFALWKKTACALALALMAGSAAAKDDALIKELELLKKRIEKLEAENRQLNDALFEPHISDEEPEITARVKALESQVNSFKPAIKTAEALDGFSAEGAFTLLSQSLNTGETAFTESDAQLNYRADFALTAPAGGFGRSSGSLFAHVRLGQGLGLENPGGAFSSFNGTSFQRPEAPDADSALVLAQAFYQLEIPLFSKINANHVNGRVELNIGKMDPFGFFDQNAIADDETRGFINQSFIHNPLLDTGGDIGADDFGFTPGVRLAYIDESSAPASYSYSLGVFASGEGAGYSGALSSPLMIAQFATEQSLFPGMKGNYRVYYWQNNRGSDFDGGESKHRGLGLSFDQRIADYVTAFVRVGEQLAGKTAFDRALTLGLEMSGNYWQRSADAVGFAWGELYLSNEFSAQNLELDLNGDELVDLTYLPESDEQVMELYYRYHFNPQLQISLNAQQISHAGGQSEAKSMTAAGMRFQFNF